MKKWLRRSEERNIQSHRIYFVSFRSWKLSFTNLMTWYRSCGNRGATGSLPWGKGEKKGRGSAQYIEALVVALQLLVHRRFTHSQMNAGVLEALEACAPIWPNFELKSLVEFLVPPQPFPLDSFQASRVRSERFIAQTSSLEQSSDT